MSNNPQRLDLGSAIFFNEYKLIDHQTTVLGERTHDHTIWTKFTDLRSENAIVNISATHVNNPHALQYNLDFISKVKHEDENGRVGLKINFKTFIDGSPGGGLIRVNFHGFIIGGDKENPKLNID